MVFTTLATMEMWMKVDFYKWMKNAPNKAPKVLLKIGSTVVL